VVAVGSAPPDLVEAYAALHDAQQAAVAAAVVGASCEDVDRVARRRLVEAGWGEWFIHRTGHGIGIEEHEDPYIVEGNAVPLQAGHAFSIEPGVYPTGRWGIRLEDIVVATDDGPLACNVADHDLVVVDA
jgi:Xaa-Pro aminopeptidase